MLESMDSMRVLAIVHQADAGPGVFSDAIRESGATLDTWSASDGAQGLSDPLEYDAVLTLGGAMHPDEDDRHPWLALEKKFLAELLERQVPLLGVCLGAELLAAAAGAQPRRLENAEIGWHRVEVQADGDPLLGPLAPAFDALEWHSYECPLPAGAAALARSANCLEAFRVGDAAWGIQFHAEVTGEDFDAWLDDYGSDPDAVRANIDWTALRMRTHDRIEAWNRLGRNLVGRFLETAKC